MPATTRSLTIPASSRRPIAAALGLVLVVAAAPFLRPASAAQPTGDATAAAETAAVTGANGVDPAIWVNPVDASKSMIFGADDVRLVTYDMTGAVKAQAALPTGTTAGDFTGVDTRNGVMVNGVATSVAAAVGNGMLHFYAIDPGTDVVTDVTATAGGINLTQYWHSGKASDVCLYESPVSGTTYAFVMAKSGEIEQIELAPNAAGKIDIKAPVRGGKAAAAAWDITSAAGSQPGGCVVDDAAKTLYVSEAAVGISKIGAEPTDPTTKTAVDSTASAGGHLLANTKGLAVVKTSDTAGYLIASTFDAVVKGSPVLDGSFNVYDRTTGAFIRTFKVIAGQAADNCQASDGIDAAVGNFSTTFASGMFLCQDLKNRVGANGAGDEAQNFKMVSLGQVVDMAGPATTTTTVTTPVTPPTTAPAQVPSRSGYWMIGSDGRVYNFGDATSYGDATLAAGAQAVDLEPTPSGNGYWIVDSLGHVFARGDAGSFGDVDRSILQGGEYVTSLSSTATGKGYWVFTTAGRVISFGDAVWYGDMSQVKLNGPVLDSIPSASGKGYYMVASDGGIFTFGDALFRGSMGNTRLNKPVQSLVPAAEGSGYWLVASDGGIFAFGGAPFRGSMASIKLNKPVTGMVRFGNGYLMVAEDGGIFSFSDKTFFGSLGDHPPVNPITSVAVLDVPVQ